MRSATIHLKRIFIFLTRFDGMVCFGTLETVDHATFRVGMEIALLWYNHVLNLHFVYYVAILSYCKDHVALLAHDCRVCCRSSGPISLRVNYGVF